MRIARIRVWCLGSGMAEKSTLEQVYGAVVDLHNHGQIVTRNTLQTATGLKLSIIDDRLSKLVEDGFICRAERGVFVPIIQHPASRVISKTILPDGTTVIDVGDEVLTLTPREAMSLGKLLMGDAMALAGVEMGHQFTQLNGILSRQILQMQRQVSDLQQGNLFGVAKDDTV